MIVWLILGCMYMYVGYTVFLLDTVSMYFIGINMNLFIKKYR